MIEKIKTKEWHKKWWGILILIGLWPISLSYWIWKRKNTARITRIVAICFVWGIAFSINTAMSVDRTTNKSGNTLRKKVPTVVLSPIPTTKEEKSVGEIREDISEKLEIFKNEKSSNQLSSTPTVSPTPDLTEDYSSYLNNVTEILDDFGEVSKTFGETLSKYPDYSIRDTYTLAAYSTVLEMYYDKFNAIKTPLKFKNVHQKLISFAKLYKDAMPMIRQGIDEDNYSLINQATVKINTANNIMQQATNEIKKMTQ